MKHILYDKCPDCGSVFQNFSQDVDQFGQVRQHTNGGIWERIQFACGREDEYVPNFYRIETNRPCSRTEEQRKKIELRKTAHANVLHCISVLNVDENFKSRLNSAVRYVDTK
jgi:hypothetical protein